MKPGKNPTTQACENMHIKSHLILRFLAWKLIDAAKAFQHISCVSVFPNILFLWFSKHKVTNPCKFSNFLSFSWPVEGLRSRIGSIHAPPLSSLKQNKTYKERGEGRKRGEHFIYSDERSITKRFFCASVQSASCTHAVIDTSSHSRAPCQCMTDIYLLYFLGQLEAEHMLWATSISEKPK